MQKRLGELLVVALHHLRLIVAAGKDHRDVRPKRPQCCQTSPSLHARHGQVAKYATDFILVLPEHLQSLDAVFGFKHRITQAREHRRGHVAHPLLVFDQQHRAALFDFRDLGRFIRLAGGLLQHDTGKKTRKTLPRPGSLSTVTTPPCALYNPQHHGQAQTSAGEFAGEKRVENFLDVLVRNPAAGVRYFQAGIGIVIRLPVDGVAVRCGDIRRGNCLNSQVNGTPALTDSLPGIGDQVGQDLLYLVRVRADG